jgi:hypothetical protein
MSPAGNLTTDRAHLCNYPRRGDPLSWITPVSLPRNELVASCLISAWPLSVPCKCKLLSASSWHPDDRVGGASVCWYPWVYERPTDCPEPPGPEDAHRSWRSRCYLH